MSDLSKKFIKILLCIFIISCSILGAIYLIGKIFYDNVFYWFEYKIKPKDVIVLFFFTPHNGLEKLCWCFIQSLFLLPTLFVGSKNYEAFPLVKIINLFFVSLFTVGNAFIHMLYSPTAIGKIFVSVLSITDTAMILMPTIIFIFAVKDFEPFKKLVRILFCSILLVTLSATFGNVGSLLGLILGICYLISYKNGNDNFITLLIHGK